jgi:hypothetical protein
MRQEAEAEKQFGCDLIAQTPGKEGSKSQLPCEDLHTMEARAD